MPFSVSYCAVRNGDRITEYEFQQGPELKDSSSGNNRSCVHPAAHAPTRPNHVAPPHPPADGPSDGRLEPSVSNSRQLHCAVTVSRLLEAMLSLGLLQYGSMWHTSGSGALPQDIRRYNKCHPGTFGHKAHLPRPFSPFRDSLECRLKSKNGTPLRSVTSSLKTLKRLDRRPVRWIDLQCATIRRNGLLAAAG